MGERMQGTIAQSMGLVLAANAARRGISVPSWPNASVFAFCSKVEFIGTEKRGVFRQRRAQFFPDPAAWLEKIRQDTEGARLRVLSRGDPNISDRNSVGFVGGGPIVLVETLGSQHTVWWSDWKVMNQSAPDNRIWSVVYRQAPPPPPPPEQEHSTADMREELAGALADASQFSAEQNMGFDESFQRASATLNSSRPLENFFYADIVPGELIDLENQQLLASCAAAWVFGGMGSWNDALFKGEDQRKYEQVSDRLFNAVMTGVAVATNSSR